MLAEHGLVIPGVRLGEEIGRGGFGRVLAGHHVALDVPVVVKLIDERAHPGGAVRTALDEARWMARLDHPNVLRVHDAGWAGGLAYLVLERMDGSLAGHHGLGGDRLQSLAAQLLSALQALHDARILHRDLKPDNCLLRTRDDRVKLADLGIAVEVVSGSAHPEQLIGTIPYLAPELLQASPRYSRATDLYALGMTLAALALDGPAHPALESIGPVLSWVASGPRRSVAGERPDLAPAVARLIDRMMSPQADQRPATAAEALVELGGNHLATVSSTAGAPTGDRVGPWALGTELDRTASWRTHAATHVVTGVPARVSFLGQSLLRLRRFVLEAAARASAIDDAQLLPVLDWGLHNGSAEYVVTAPAGRTLRDVVVSSGPLSEPEALRLLASVAGIVARLHARDLVYQVVEPSAVLVGPHVTATLSWPVFCATRGTPARTSADEHQRAVVTLFGAPEAFSRRGTIEPSVDVWGLGELLYFSITGRAAYERPNEALVIVAKNDPPDPLGEAGELVTKPTRALLSAMLSQDPQLRPSAVEVQDRANRLLRTLIGTGPTAVG